MRNARRRAQAMVELIVALVAVLAIAAGLLQVASLGRAHTEAMVEARREAGHLCMLDFVPLSDPDYIRDWEPGPDGKKVSRDDLPQLDAPAQFDDLIVEKAANSAAGWAILGSVDNDLPPLRNHFDPVSVFGLVRGYDTEVIPLLSAVQSLLYQAPSIEVVGEVWMTHTTGIE